MTKTRRYANDRILCFADVHFPYHHEGLFDFLADIKRDLKPDRILINGDLTDSYQFSSYAKDLGADSVTRELKNLRKSVGKLIKIFPDVTITSSNHDIRLWRKAKIAGIPREVLMPYAKMIGADKANWKLVPEQIWTVDATREQWTFMHHLSGSSINGAKGMDTNLVLSHTHTKQGLVRSQGIKKSYWAVDTGCLINEKTYAFNYQKLSQNKPVLGACFIEEGTPRIIPFKP